MNSHKILILFIIVFGLVGCEQASKGFSLPIGDPAKGEEVFMSMQCLSCHEMEGYDRPEGGEDKLSVTLGGKVATLKTYAELVTSVINPSHQLAEGYELSEIQESGESVMPVYNNIMTVEQLINLITFLESRYELEPYTRTEYIIYR
ncbi:c-type cytochrome [Photobacterium alginatilyticum]|uniref:C-type cytochrome n=1 Tax=Photobacterium alginatilyticum TaxID=1775171 RepID=A0ABW9YIL1_9GAMM|nr:c-type cytochrome [Photobacterium alginatilyticum]NBI53106.1 c-type cytochrome [Photobacterium alginatilyticum]